VGNLIEIAKLEMHCRTKRKFQSCFLLSPYVFMYEKRNRLCKTTMKCLKLLKSITNALVLDTENREEFVFHS